MANNYVDISSKDPDVTGRVTFKRANSINLVTIDARQSEIALSGSRVLKLSDVPLDALSLAGCIATCEVVITSAPKGFYLDVNGEPQLAPGLLYDTDALWAVYGAWRSYQDTFRAVAREPEIPTNDNPDLAGSESN